MNIKAFSINFYRRLNIPIFLICIMSIALLISLQGKKDAFSLNIALPTKGSMQEHKNIETALNIYKDNINSSGGIEGRQLEIKFASDLDNNNLLQDAVKQEKFLAISNGEGKSTIPTIGLNLNVAQNKTHHFLSNLNPKNYGVYMARYIK